MCCKIIVHQPRIMSDQLCYCMQAITPMNISNCYTERSATDELFKHCGIDWHVIRLHSILKFTIRSLLCSEAVVSASGWSKLREIRLSDTVGCFPSPRGSRSCSCTRLLPRKSGLRLAGPQVLRLPHYSGADVGSCETGSLWATAGKMTEKSEAVWWWEKCIVIILRLRLSHGRNPARFLSCEICNNYAHCLP
jgi:hypothetical protein